MSESVHMEKQIEYVYHVKYRRYVFELSFPLCCHFNTLPLNLRPERLDYMQTTCAHYRTG